MTYSRLRRSPGGILCHAGNSVAAFRAQMVKARLQLAQKKSRHAAAQEVNREASNRVDSGHSDPEDWMTDERNGKPLRTS